MEKTFERVYQLKISMKGIVPQIWRRVQIPENYTFFWLHYVIQTVMDWDDYHLHEFEMPDPRTGIPVKIGVNDDDFEDFFERTVLPEEDVNISDYFTLGNKDALYRYDFGDNWQVKVRLEKILPRKEGVEYPVCTAGKRAAVPEDIGGIWGYENMLEVLKDPEHEDYEDTVEWLGEDFDPEYFDPEDVLF